MLPFACLFRPIDDSIFISKTKTPHSGDKNGEFNEQAAEPVRDLRKSILNQLRHWPFFLSYQHKTALALVEAQEKLFMIGAWSYLFFYIWCSLLEMKYRH
jgi:hypothetical protein